MLPEALETRTREEDGVLRVYGKWNQSALQQISIEVSMLLPYATAILCALNDCIVLW